MILSYLTILTQCARILLNGTSPDVITQMQGGFLGAAHEKTNGCQLGYLIEVKVNIISNKP